MCKPEALFSLIKLLHIRKKSYQKVLRNSMSLELKMLFIPYPGSNGCNLERNRPFQISYYLPDSIYISYTFAKNQVNVAAIARIERVWKIC